MGGGEGVDDETSRGGGGLVLCRVECVSDRIECVERMGWW